MTKIDDYIRNLLSISDLPQTVSMPISVGSKKTKNYVFTKRRFYENLKSVYENKFKDWWIFQIIKEKSWSWWNWSEVVQLCHISHQAQPRYSASSGSHPDSRHPGGDHLHCGVSTNIETLLTHRRRRVLRRSLFSESSRNPWRPREDHFTEDGMSSVILDALEEFSAAEFLDLLKFVKQVVFDQKQYFPYGNWWYMGSGVIFATITSVKFQEHYER